MHKTLSFIKHKTSSVSRSLLAAGACSLGLFCFAFVVTVYMGKVTKSYIIDGAIFDTSDPICDICALVWPMYAVSIGVLASLLVRRKVNNLLRCAAAVFVAFVLLYAPAIVLSRFLGNQGFWGLLGYHGQAYDWNSLKVACIASPTMSGIMAVIVSLFPDSAKATMTTTS